MGRFSDFTDVPSPRRHHRSFRRRLPTSTGEPHDEWVATARDEAEGNSAQTSGSHPGPYRALPPGTAAFAAITTPSPFVIPAIDIRIRGPETRSSSAGRIAPFHVKHRARRSRVCRYAARRWVALRAPSPSQPRTPSYSQGDHGRLREVPTGDRMHTGFLSHGIRRPRGVHR